MTDFMDDLLGIAKEQADLGQQSEVNLARISELVRESNDYDAEIADLENKLNAAKKAQSKILEITLPDLMTELGLSEFKTNDDVKVTVKPFVNISIKEENRQAAHQWLLENGAGEIVKISVVTEFDAGQDNMAKAHFDTVRQMETGENTKMNTGVHGATLKAWAKRRREAGEEIDAELFTLYEGQKASFKKGK